jgi:SAM-dependent methyltransferase
VHEILRLLGPDDRVLDLGCRSGSFRNDECAATIVRADLDHAAGQGCSRFVCCDARALPFAGQSFHAVVLNHSLEHFQNPAAALGEIRRILRQPAYLYAAVPDASTLTDRIYRWLGRGGGHVNRFTDVHALVRLIEKETALPHVATRLLFTSFSFLNRHNIPHRKPLRLYLVGGGAEPVLRLGTLLLRTFDRWAGTRTSVYGWSCYFGCPLDVDARPWSNVCVRCGSGHAADALIASGSLRRGRFGALLFDCPACGTKNYFTGDQPYSSMR